MSFTLNTAIGSTSNKTEPLTEPLRGFPERLLTVSLIHDLNSMTNYQWPEKLFRSPDGWGDYLFLFTKEELKKTSAFC